LATSLDGPELPTPAWRICREHQSCDACAGIRPAVPARHTNRTEGGDGAPARHRGGSHLALL